MIIQTKIEKVLARYSPSCKYNVQLTHDGFDSDCYPKSYIYTLLVWEDGKVYDYHYENWFHPGDAEEEFGLFDARDESEFFEHNIYGLKHEDFEDFEDFTPFTPLVREAPST